MDIFKLNMELDALLKKHPHLLDLQLEISKNLAKFNTSESRMYYLSIEMMDSFYLLKDKLKELDGKIKHW